MPSITSVDSATPTPESVPGITMNDLAGDEPSFIRRKE
jgi:hypothetical protein